MLLLLRLSMSEGVNLNLSRDTILRLKQYGLNHADIESLKTQYLAQPGVATENGFRSFCLKQNLIDVHRMLTPPSNWRPSQPVIESLIKKGMTAHQIEFLLGTYLQIPAIEPNPNWDKAFQQYCHRSIGPSSTGGKIPHDWYPSEAIASTLLSMGMSQKELDLLVGEYRIYWIERDENRPDWDVHFRRWAERKISHPLNHIPAQRLI